MRKNLRNWLELVIISEMFGMFAIFYWIFVTAYLSPYKMTRVYIDKFGEANIEIVLMSFMLIVFFGYVLYRAKIFAKEVEG